MMNPKRRKPYWVLGILCTLGIQLFGCTNRPAATPDASIPPTQAPDLSQDFAYCDQALDAFLPEGTTLPTSGPSGASISWSVESGNAVITDGIIYKTETSQEKEPVSLTATITQEGSSTSQTYDHLLLLDEYAGWVLSYFTKEDDTKETLKLAYSFDGRYWYHLNGDQPICSAQTGTKRIRDPFLMRTKDGFFALLATQGYDNPSIYVFDSPDLITYSNERLLQVNTTSDQLPMSQSQAWAPEGFYDRQKDQYFLYWSSPNDEGMYYNYSFDLISFTPPEKLLDTGFPVIDGTIVKEGARYSILLKDERQPMEEYSQIFYGTSSSDYLHFDTFFDPITGHQSEGPFVLQTPEMTYIYYDDYTRFQYLLLDATSIYDGSFTQDDGEGVLFPMEQPSHASAIAVTWKELEALQNVYGE